MPKRTIILDMETSTPDEWQRAAEALAAVEAGLPVHEALGEPVPPELSEMTLGAILGRLTELVNDD